MGLFWDLIQQSQISVQQTSTQSLEGRMTALEREVSELRRIQLRLLEVLEEHFGRDINDDGMIG